MRVFVAIFCWLCQFAPLQAYAEMASLLGGNALQTSRISIMQKPSNAVAPEGMIHDGSLFAGQGGLGLFAPHPVRPAKVMMRRAPVAASPLSRNLTVAAHIRQIISQAEAGRKGYDAVQHGARRLPRKLPTQMTIAEIYQWIEQTPGQPHAIGRYQFIPVTLKRLVRKLKMSPHETFNETIQDRLADVLLEEAGLSQAKRGEISRQTFMNNLAKIWAGLPNSTGKSHYHGHAGNRATMTWARFSAEMEKIFPS